MFELLNKTVKYKNDDCPITVFKNMKKSFIKNFFFFRRVFNQELSGDSV